MKNIEKLIQNDALEKALEELKKSNFSGNQEISDEIMFIFGWISNLNKQVRHGLISTIEAEISRNKIRKSIVGIYKELK